MPGLSKSPRNPSRRPGGCAAWSPLSRASLPPGPGLLASRLTAPPTSLPIEIPSIHAFIHSFAQHKDSDAYGVPGIQTRRK